jgi:hypothetical protein
MSNDLNNIISQLELKFQLEKESATIELEKLIQDAQEALKSIREADGFVASFPGGGPTFSGEKATMALAALAASREAVGVVR